MATALDAASARMACSIAKITDKLTVSNVNTVACTMDVLPVGALNPGKKFSDYEIDDEQMAFLLEALKQCSPEQSVRTAMAQWSKIPASTEIDPVVGQLEGELLKIVGWDGKCMTDGCCD
jgi:hypothetical protein